MRYSRKRALAIHEAGHAATAYLLGRRFDLVSLGDGERHGQFALAKSADWPAPETIEDRVMILLAGAEAERCWSARAGGAPAGWLERAGRGRERDAASAGLLADYACGAAGPAAVDGYLTEVRGKVLDLAGHGPLTDPRPGDERFWALTGALAKTLCKQWVLTGPEAAKVLAGADPAR